ncbi:MAG: NACHT domain-containing protein [Pseudomonadota bacterium]
MSGNHKQNMSFEAEVRRIADAIWRQDSGVCQPAHYTNDPVISELDGLVRLRDITHLMMVTTSTKLNKVKSDVKKLNAAETIERKKALAVAKWFITQSQLDAEHIEFARKNNVTALTLDQFRRRFFDGASYLTKRAIAPFGSARNPSDNSSEFAPNAYVPLPIRANKIPKNATTPRTATNQELVSLNNLVDKLTDGARVVLLAPFGSGKSLTTREVFRKLSSLYYKGETNHVPVALNLREHWGQEYFDEILERHARSIGFSPKEDLVSAWRAGMITVLLDGFDEVASQSISRLNEKHFMRQARREALQGVRDLVLKMPNDVGLWICGRDHYFDNDKELIHALGLNSHDFTLAYLDEFTEEGAHDFLKRNGVDHQLPAWLPRKPLLLAYLTQNSLLESVLEIDSSYGFGYSWNHFLDLIVQREAALEKAAMEPDILRSVMERLAFTVRSRPSGAGPITGTDLSDVYAKETGQVAGEAVLAQLQRLPGLTQRDSDPGARSFVDEDMLAALQGGAFAKMVLGHFMTEDKVVISALPNKAVAMAAYVLQINGGDSQTVISVMEREGEGKNSQLKDPQFIADAFSVALEMAQVDECESLDFRGLLVEEANLGKVDLEEVPVKNLAFRSCIIEEVVLGRGCGGWNLTFSDCIISRVSGVADATGLPESVFIGGEVESFDDMGTNNAVLNAEIAPGLKALLTVLRKLYKQAGTGRKVTAFSRGVGQKEVSECINPVLSILQKEGMVSIYNKVVHPVRKFSGRVERILSAPTLSDDPVVKEALKLNS